MKSKPNPASCLASGLQRLPELCFQELRSEACGAVAESVAEGLADLGQKSFYQSYFLLPSSSQQRVAVGTAGPQSRAPDLV